MDSQFPTLMSSYHDNYLQYKTTGDPKYQTAYQAAQSGLDNIIASMQEQTDAQKSAMADFYKSGVEQKLREQQDSMRELRGDLMSQKDAETAAKLRAPVAVAPPTPSTTIPTWEIFGIGTAILAVGVGSYLLFGRTSLPVS